MRTWGHIYADNSDKLKGVCRRYVKSDEIAEDIMHDAFEIAMQKIDSYSGKGSFDGWLYQITVNTALQYLRNNKKTVNKTDDIIDYHINKTKDIELPQSKKSQIHQANFEVSDLLEAIDLLPEHHRTVFNLYVLEKKTHQEISETLNISLNTSKSHLNRARKKLQDILFDKAKNKEKDNLKKYLLLLFPFYFSIDRTYASSFKNYKLKSNINRVEVSKINVNEKNSFTNLSKLISLVIISAIVTSLVLFLSKDKNHNYKSIKIKETTSNQQFELPTYIRELDSLFQLKENSLIKKPTLLSKQKKKKQVEVQVPVVIHKQVIIKDTIQK